MAHVWLSFLLYIAPFEARSVADRFFRVCETLIFEQIQGTPMTPLMQKSSPEIAANMPTPGTTLIETQGGPNLS